MRAAAVEGIENIARFITASLTRRTDCGIWTDSNGAQGSIGGHLEGMMLGMAGKFGLYAMAAMAGNPASIYGTGIAGHGGAAYNQSSPPAEFQAIQCPTVSAVDGSSIPHGNVDWCGTLPGNVTIGGVMLNTKCPVDLNGAFELSTTIWRPASNGVTLLRPTLHGSPGAGAGQFILSSKTANAPTTRSPDGIDEVVCQWNRGEIIDFNNSVNAANSSANYFGAGFKARHRAYTGDATPIDGANVFGIINSRFIDSEKFTGSAVTMMYQFGGQPTRAVTLDVVGITGSGGWSDLAIAAKLKGMVISQRNRFGVRLPPMLLMQIIQGGNDAGDSNASILSTTGEYRSGVTQTGVAGSTRQGYFNNTVSIIRRLKYVWTKVLGYDAKNLFFLIGCYHPQSVGTNAAQWTFVRTTMVDAMRDVMNAEPNVAAVDGYKIATVAEMGCYKGTATVLVDTTQREYNQINSPNTVQSQGWFKVPDADQAHLTQQGYIAWGQRIWDSIFDAWIQFGGTQALLGGNSSEIQTTR